MARLLARWTQRFNWAFATARPRRYTDLNSVSNDAVVFAFEGLDDGDSVTIEFRLRMPEEAGAAANAVVVYDGQDVARARGVRLETMVE